MSSLLLLSILDSLLASHQVEYRIQFQSFSHCINPYQICRLLVGNMKQHFTTKSLQCYFTQPLLSTALTPCLLPSTPPLHHLNEPKFLKQANVGVGGGGRYHWVAQSNQTYRSENAVGSKRVSPKPHPFLPLNKRGTDMHI